MAKKPTAAKATSPEPYFHATVRTGEAVTPGSPFNPDASNALNHLSGYVYVAVERKASAVASGRLMVYKAKKRGRGKSVGKTKLEWLRSAAHGKSAMWAAMADDVEAVPDHPILRLMQFPNPHWSGSELAHLDAMFLESTGNSYLHVVTDRKGVPMELWPLFPQATRVIPDENTLVKGYLYGRDPTDAQVFVPDEVSHARLPNPFNPYYGLAPIMACMLDADVYNAGNQQELALMDNYARPDMLVNVKGNTIPKEVRERIDQQINQRHRGVKNRGKYLILSGDINVTPLQFNPKDMAWVDQQKWLRDNIAAAYGVPVSMLTVEAVNLANAQSGLVQFLKLSIMPRLCILADRLTNDILPMYGSEPGEYWVAYDNPVPDDEAFVAQTNVAYVNAGIRTINEARQMEGADAIEGGDTLRVNGQPVAATFADTLPPTVQPIEAQDIGAPTEAPYDAARGQAILDVLGKVQRAELDPQAAIAFLVGVVGLDQAQASSMVNAQVSVVVEPEEPEEEEDAPAVEEKRAKSLKDAWDNHGECLCCKDADVPPTSDEYSEGTPVGEPEGTLPDQPKPPSRFVKELMSYFADQRDAALAAMEAEPDAIKSKPGGFFQGVPVWYAGWEIKGLDDALREWNLAASEWDVKLLTTVRQSLDGIAENGAEGALKELAGLLGEKPMPPDVTFNLEDPAYVAAFDSEAGRFVRSVNDETEKQIRAALQAGVESGESIKQLRDRVSAVFDVSDSRAETIARTETARFNGLGRLTQMKQSGVPMKKRWLLAGGACSLCRTIAEKGDIPLSQPFWQLGEQIIGEDGEVYVNDFAPVVTQPAHPNDRCQAIFVVDPAYLEGA